MDNDTLRLGSTRLPYFRTSDFADVMLEIESMTKALIGTDAASRLAILAASGTGAMEAAVISTFTRLDKVLVVEGGDFGRRFGQICRVHGIPYEPLHLAFGEELTLDHIQKYDAKGFTGMLVNIHETSTGQLYNIDLIRSFCQANQILLVIDAIGSFLADYYHMDNFKADVTILSSQKGLGLPPGLSLVVANHSTCEKRIFPNSPTSFYFALSRYFTDMLRGQTPFTPAQSIVYQLHDKLRRITQAGVESYIHHSAMLASDLRSRLTCLPLVVPEYNLSNALTPVICEKAYDIFLRLKEEHDMYVNPAGGDFKEVLLRIGHLGNLTVDDNRSLVEALQIVMTS